MNKNIIEKLKHITIVYNNWITSVKLMIQEHYDIPEYDNCIIYINVYPSYDNDTILYLGKFTKRIFYCLEHTLTDNDYDICLRYYNEPYIKLLIDLNFNEMWSMDYNYQFTTIWRDRCGFPVKYVPMRYTSLIKSVDNIYTTPKTVDFCMVGIIIKECTKRRDFIGNVEKDNVFSIKNITQFKNINSIIPELNTAKYILDTNRCYEIHTQNQVRIFELLCMGYTVCVEKSPVNLFPGLIYEYTSIDDLNNILIKNEYLHPTKAYKEMTYTDEAYENYVNNLIQLQSND